MHYKRMVKTKTGTSKPSPPGLKSNLGGHNTWLDFGPGGLGSSTLALTLFYVALP